LLCGCGCLGSFLICSSAPAIALWAGVGAGLWAIRIANGTKASVSFFMEFSNTAASERPAAAMECGVLLLRAGTVTLSAALVTGIDVDPVAPALREGYVREGLLIRHVIAIDAIADSGDRCAREG